MKAKGFNNCSKLCTAQSSCIRLAAIHDSQRRHYAGETALHPSVSSQVHLSLPASSAPTGSRLTMHLHCWHANPFMITNLQPTEV